MAAQQTQIPDKRLITLDALALQAKQRGILIGMTESGKSRLAEHMIRNWHETQADPFTLIIDSKPHFRAKWRLNGTTTRGLYSRLDQSEKTWPDSYLIPMRNPASELRQVRAHGARVAIAQGTLEDIPSFLATIKAFYDGSNARRQNLLYIDEVADFFGTSGATARGNPILQVWRSGRERGVAGLASTQRPKGLPKSLLTETTLLAMFELAYPDDVDHIREMGLPADAAAPEPDGSHAFYYYNRKHRQLAGLYRLRLEA